VAAAIPNSARRSRSGTSIRHFPAAPPKPLAVPCDAPRSGAALHAAGETDPEALQSTQVADALDLSSRLGIEVARTISLNYSNQETSFTVGESVRDEDVFIIQSTATGDVNEGLMELLIIISACRTAR
jgi:hypothetical protein